MPSIVVLRSQMQNIKMESSKLVIKSIVQNQMAEFGFERRFHDLKYFELGTFLASFLNLI